MNYTDMLIESTREIFETMVMVPVEAQAFLDQRPETFHDSVSAIVGLSGELRGLVAVHSPDPVALNIFSSMLGEEAEHVDEEVRDTIGEIVNMLAGGMKSRLLSESCNVELSVPSIIAGKAYEVNMLSNAQCLLQTFVTQAGAFLVEFKYAQSH